MEHVLNVASKRMSFWDSPVENKKFFILTRRTVKMAWPLQFYNGQANLKVFSRLELERYSHSKEFQKTQKKICFFTKNEPQKKGETE